MSDLLRTRLYQFPFSHYCEKARWALDRKGIGYYARNLLPGLHVGPARKVARSTSLPILVDEHGATQGSSVILDHLDRCHAQAPLTPSEPTLAEEARCWERRLDEEVGVTLRLWFYHHTLQDRRLALGFLTRGATWRGRLLLAAIFPRLRRAMRERMGIDAASAERAERRLRAALDELDATVETTTFLVGESFSRADLTACALLEPLCAPGRRRDELAFPQAVLAVRDELSARPFFGWVARTYATERGR
jgi:glutathione S-transferase